MELSHGLDCSGYVKSIKTNKSNFSFLYFIFSIFYMTNLKKLHKTNFNYFLDLLYRLTLEYQEF